MKRLNVHAVYGVIKLSLYDTASERTVSEEVTPIINASRNILVDLNNTRLDALTLGSFSNILKIYQKQWGEKEKLFLVNAPKETEQLFRKGKIADQVSLLEDYADFFLLSD